MTPKPYLKALLLVFLVVGMISVCLLEIQPVESVILNVTGNVNDDENLTINITGFGKTEIKPDQISNNSLEVVYTGKGRPEPYQILKNKTHYIIIGAYPTKKGYSYERYDTIILNWCPKCKKDGCLEFEIASQVNWYTSPEGLLYCKETDMDFSLVSFVSHDNRKYKLKGKIIN